MSDLVVTPEFDPVDGPPPAKKLRIPLWLRWVVGIPMALIAIVFIALPPQRSVSLNGWTPGCPELEAEPWREVLLGRAELELTGVLEASEVEHGVFALPSWLLVDDELWVSPVAIGGETFNQLVIRHDGATTQRVMLPATEIGDALISSTAQSTGWLHGDRIWLPVSRYDDTRVIGWELVALDRHTLQEQARVTVPVAMKAVAHISVNLHRLPVVDDESWTFIAFQRRSVPGGKSQTGFKVLQFDPEEGRFGESYFMTRPEIPMYANPTPRAAAFVLWTDAGPTFSMGDPPMIWHLDPRPANGPPQLFPATTIPAPKDPLELAMPVGMATGLGWDTDHWEASTGQSSAIRLEMGFREFAVQEAAGQIWRHAPAANPRTQTSTEREAAARRLQQRTDVMDALGRFDADLQHRYTGTRQVGHLHLATSWDPVFRPARGEFGRSVHATVQYIGDSWFGRIPGMEVFVLDEDTSLIAQVVLTGDDVAHGHPHGLLRLGLLEAPATDIRWIGFVPLPAKVRELKSGLLLACAATSDSWLIGLTGLHEDAEAPAHFGSWWTRVDFPTGFSMPYTGWMSGTLPPSMDPARDSDPSAAAVHVEVIPSAR